MANDLKKFAIFIGKDWVALMSGIGSLILAFLGAIGGWTNGPPSLMLWVVAFLCLIVCAFRVWQKESHEHEKTKERIRTKLIIVGVAKHPLGDDHRRIMIHNKTSKEIEFRAKLVETKPDLGLVLPLNLQPTHNQETNPIGKIGPNDTQPLDVLVDWGVQNNIGIKLMGNPPNIHCFPRNMRLELLISVYPTSEEGEADRRWFYIVPQYDGSVILTANGSSKEPAKPQPLEK